MEIIITEWGLDSYLNLKGRQVFTGVEYKVTIRPDVLRLKNYPANPKADPVFGNHKFWSEVECPPGVKVQDGFKMKWHQMGNGKVQVRCPVAILMDAFLCEAYVKKNPKRELRMLARFKTHLQLIRTGRWTERGRLS